MLLAADIGNSNIVIGAYKNDEWKHQWRLITEPEKKTAEYERVINRLLSEADLAPGDFEHVIISSVVPVLTEKISRIFKHASNRPPVILDEMIDTGISLGTADPSSVGADLIADAAGAWHLFGETCIIVDFGTATTVMVVKEPGVLTGGAICAGLKVTEDALVGRTALLPHIPIDVPPSVIGTDTVEAMQSGLVLGHLCMVEGLIDRMKRTLGDAKVVATGGFSELLALHTGYFDVVDPFLTLNGLRFIAERQGRGQ